MKRLRGLSLLLVLITGILAGCAKMPAGHSESNIPNTQSMSDSSNAFTTRLHTDKAGRQVEIPANPQRVATVSSTT